MAFRPTEFSVRDILLEELRARNVRTALELSFSMPQGRKPPDGVLANGATYVLETKLGGEADYFEDLKRLTEWIKLRTAPIQGAFAVLFPRELRRLPWESLREVARSPKVTYEVAALFRDQRPGDRKSGDLSVVADWIAEQVLRPPREVEPDTNFVVTVLAGAVNELTHRMSGLTEKEVEDIFGGQPVFQNILEIAPGRLPLDNMRRAAAYLLVNQLIFYGVLSRADPDSYPLIDADSLRNPSDLAAYFQRVLEVDYAPTFGFDVASRLPSDATDTIRSVLDVIQTMGLSRLRQDVLGKVFHNLIPLSVRKPVAAYYTNKQAADLLASLAINEAGDRVLDPACGSGTLLVASYQKKRRLKEDEGHPFSLEDHARFLGTDITGIDIMPFAAHLAVVHLSLQAPRFVTQKVRVAVWDSTDLEPGEMIPSITRELARAFRKPTLEMFEGTRHLKEDAKYVTKGSFTVGGVGGEEIHLEPVDVVVMNPPFTSSDHLGADYKKVLKERFAEQYSSYLQGKISFQGHFLLLADRFLKPGGRIAAVLPQTTLTAKAFEPLVDMLREKYSIQAVVVGLGRSAFSENTALSEILFVAQKAPPPKGHRFALVGTKKSPSDWTSGEINSIIDRLHARRDHDDSLAVVRRIPQKDLSIESGGLTRFLPTLIGGYKELQRELKPVFDSPLMFSYGEWEEKAGVRALYTPLGNREAPGPQGRGGVWFGTSGLNVCRDERRALKRVDRLILVREDESLIRVRDRITETEFDIPRTAVVPAVRRLSDYPSFDVSTATDLVAAQPYAGLLEVMKTLYGDEKGRTFFTRVQERWHDRVREGMSHLTLARRVDVAGPGTHHLAVYTNPESFTGASAWCFRGVSVEDAKLMCLWFNSSLFLVQIAERRAQTRGTWWYLNKHGIVRTKVPDLSALSPDQKQQLLATFDELAGVEFPNLLEQLRSSFEARRRLDIAWLSVLGVPGERRESIVSAIHAYLHDALGTLVAAMGKD